MPEIYNHIAYTYYYAQQHDSALYYFYTVLDLLKKEKKLDTLQIAYVYMNIGAVFEQADKTYDRALAYTRKALLWAKQTKDVASLAQIYLNMASIHTQMNHNDSARIYIGKSGQIYQQLGQVEQMQKCYNLTASMWLLDKNVAQAKLYLDSALRQKRGNMDQKILQNIACILYYSGQLQKAVQYYEQTLPLWQSAGEEKSRLENLSILATIYDSLHQYRMASQHHKAYAALKDSIVNEEKLRSLNQMEVKYRTIEKDKVLTEKQLLIARQKDKLQQLYLGLATAALIIVSLLYLLHRRKQKTTISQLKASLAGEEKERQRMASELHDGIVSKLSSVKMSFDTISHTWPHNKNEGAAFEDAVALLDQSIAELRTTSHNLQPSVLLHAGLAAAVDIYCQKMSQVSRLQIQFLLFGELPALNPEFELNVYRIIQELVQNIVKHAEATQARVQFNLLPETLLVTIEDNGNGIPTEKWHTQDGIGLYNLRQRLKVLGGGIDLTNQNGTSIYLSFDIKQFSIPKNEN